MNAWIDFKELREQLNFADVLRHYGVELNMNGEQHHGFCALPLHQGKAKTRSFSANVKKGIWQCFGCHQNGNLLDFAVLMEGADPENGENVRQIALKLKAVFLDAPTVVQEPEKELKDCDEAAVVNAPLDFELKGLDATHPYLHKRGFRSEER